MVRSLRENIFKKTLNISLVIFFIFFISAFFYSITHRVFYPFELNWLEGEMFLNSLRVLEGKTIYQEPSSEFITEIYPPVFYWIGSFFLFISVSVVFSIRFSELFLVGGVAVFQNLKNAISCSPNQISARVFAEREIIIQNRNFLNFIHQKHHTALAAQFGNRVGNGH